MQLCQSVPVLPEHQRGHWSGGIRHSRWREDQRGHDDRERDAEFSKHQTNLQEWLWTRMVASRRLACLYFTETGSSQIFSSETRPISAAESHKHPARTFSQAVAKHDVRNLCFSLF